MLREVNCYELLMGRLYADFSLEYRAKQGIEWNEINKKFDLLGAKYDVVTPGSDTNTVNLKNYLNFVKSYVRQMNDAMNSSFGKLELLVVGAGLSVDEKYEIQIKQQKIEEQLRDRVTAAPAAFIKTYSELASTPASRDASLYTTLKSSKHTDLMYDATKEKPTSESEANASNVVKTLTRSVTMNSDPTGSAPVASYFKGRVNPLNSANVTTSDQAQTAPKRLAFPGPGASDN